MNANYRTKVEPMKDIHLAKTIFDDKTYFKSISTFMQEVKSPIAETKRNFY